MNKIITTITLTALISCSKSDTHTPTPNTPDKEEEIVTVSIPLPTTTYFSSTYVESNMHGKWSVYKHTHVRHDSTYEVYQTPTYNVIDFNTLSLSLTYNLTTPEPYTYDSLDIQSINHHYNVHDMSEDKAWMYVYTHTPSYVVGFDTMFYSLSRVR